MKRAKIQIEGIVQGVGFRNFVRQNATYLKLKGFTKNNQDDTVLVLVEGSEEAINLLIEKCWQGPPLSKVTKITLEDQEYKGEFNYFKIK